MYPAWDTKVYAPPGNSQAAVPNFDHSYLTSGEKQRESNHHVLYVHRGYLLF